ncbi:MAG: hypothetical protein JST16_04050 [Bdellovibrionales bacterium]|nr:hypothetical protein [Bdellovibrionales bacterium]
MSQTSRPFLSPLEKLRRISPHRHQLWVVAYVNQDGGNLVDQAFADVDASLGGGADAVVLINEWSSLAELESTMQAVRKRYPKIPLGVNYLGDEAEPYGYVDSFRLAREYNLCVVWTDFSGVDLIKERKEVSLHAIETLRPSETFYCSGVHMKYSTLIDPGKSIEQSALQAMGWVDGVIVTGPKTGVAANPEQVQRARSVMGDYPLGIASGVSVQNVAEVLPSIDFCLVASSLQNEAKRIQRAKVEELARAMHGS